MTLFIERVPGELKTQNRGFSGREEVGKGHERFDLEGIMNDTSPVPVPFHGNTLYLIDQNGEPFTPMKPIVEGMGLDWNGQHKKLRANESRWGISVMEIPSQSGEQETLCMPLRKLPGWLMTVQVSRLKPQIREKALAFQNECDDVLWNYWSKGRVLPSPPVPDREAIRDEIRRILAENPSDPYVPNFADGITCLDDLARVAAEECNLETCRRIDLSLWEIRRVLETGRDCLGKLDKAGQDLSEERRMARKWRGSVLPDYISAEFRKGCQS